LIIASCIHSVS